MCGGVVLIEIPVDNAKSVGYWEIGRRPQKCGYEKFLVRGSRWSRVDKMVVV